MAITWLHISDLHRGQPGDGRWDRYRDVVMSDIRDRVRDIGRPDLILFTGDLAFAGTRNDYDKVDETLNDIYECIGDEALLVTVPGNHDLIRPDPSELQALACKQYFSDEQVRRSLLQGHESTVAFFAGLFAEYQEWWRRRVLATWQRRRLRYKEGPFPGNFVVTFEKEDLRLGIAGINSAFLHFGDLDKGALAVESEQLGPWSLSRWRDEHEASLLLMHHPRDWLHPTSSLPGFLELIYPANTFTACCFGHMHEHSSETTIHSGSDVRRWIQAASLFGLERWGRRQETRAIGYAWGRLATKTARTGVLTRWPVVARPTDSGSIAMFNGDIRPFPHTEEVALHERRPQTVCRVLVVAVPEEFPFAPTSLVQRIEELRPGLVCSFVSADDDQPQSEPAELVLVLVGALQGKGTTLTDHITDRRNRVFACAVLNAKVMRRPDSDPKALADLVEQRGDAAWFSSEAEILSQVRPALDIVCRPPAQLPENPVDDPLVSYAVDDLEERRADAKTKFAAGAFEEALIAYRSQVSKAEKLREANPDSPEINALWTRARVNVAACYLALRDNEKARETLAAIDAALLPTDARAVFAKLLINVRLFESAEAALSQTSADVATELWALLSVSRGQIPSTRPESTDILIYSAQLLAKEERFHTALEWILRALPRIEDPVLGPLAVAETLMDLLERWAWAEKVDDRLTPTDAATLLDNLNAILGALRNRELAAAHRRRALEIENGLGLRTDDVARVKATRDALTAMGADEVNVDASFDAAIALGKSGDVEEATRVVLDDKHAWRGRYRQIGILTVVGDYATALEFSLRLVQEFPGRLNTEYEVARHLARADRKQEAIAHARAAFDALPGYGQRLLLAELSLFAADYTRCAELTRSLADAGDLLALELFALASEHLDIADAVASWEKYANSGAEFETHARIRISALQFRAGLHTEAADSAWKTFTGGNARSLSAQTLYQFALLQAVGARVDARERVTTIALQLKECASSESDEMYLQLWSWLQAPHELPAPNFESLIATGALRPVSTSDFEQALQAGAAQTTSWQRAFFLGHVPFEAMLSELGWSVAAFVSNIGDGLVLPAVDVADPDKPLPKQLSPSRLLVSDLELLFAARMKLLERLTEALPEDHEILIFEDVHLRLMQNLTTLRLGNPSARAAESERLLAALADPEMLRVGELEPEHPLLGREVSRDAVVAWLRNEGRISKSKAETLGSNLDSFLAWKPPADFACDRSSLTWLTENDLLRDLIALYGAPLRIGTETAEQLRTERAHAKREEEALELCERVAAWLETQVSKKAARIIVRAAVELPPAKNSALEKPRQWVAAALSWRVSADQHDAYCLTVDACVRDLFSGLYLPSVLHSIEWNPEALMAAKERFRPLSERILGFGWLSTRLQLSLANRERLIRAGCGDVADGETLAGLLEEYPTRGALENVFDVLEAPLRNTTHSKSMAAQLLLGRAYAGVVKQLFSGKTSSAAEFMKSTLARWEAHGGRGISGLLAFVMPTAFDKPKSGFAPSGEHTSVASPDTSIGQLFSTLVEWGAKDKRRRSILNRAAAETVALVGKASQDAPSAVTLALLQLLCDTMQPEAGPIDLSDNFFGALAIAGAVWPESPLSTVAAQVTRERGGETESVDLIYEDVVIEAVRALEGGEKPLLTPLLATWEKTVLDGHVLVTMPVEAVLLRCESKVASEISKELAVLQGPNDGLMYRLLMQLSHDPSNRNVRHQISQRAIRSPWKRTVRDPVSILEWGNVDAVHIGAPHRLDQLEQLLSEPSGFSEDVSAVARLERYVKDPWAKRADVEMLGVSASAVPGVAGYQAAQVLSLDEQLREASAVIKHHVSSSFGQIWTSLGALIIAAKTNRRIGDVSVGEFLDQALPNIIASSLDDPSRGVLESALLRQCRNIVSNFHPAPNNLVWLTYRLFSWLWIQIRSSDPAVTRSVLEELTASPVPAVVNMPAVDTMDPALWRDFPNLRLAAALSIAALADGLPGNENEERWLLPLTDELRVELVRVASMPISPAEKQMRRFSSSQWEWIGTVVPQESALHLLLRDFKNFALLDATVRLAWLQELPAGEDDGIRDVNVVGRLLLAAAGNVPTMSEPEKETLLSRLTLSTSSLVLEGAGQAFALVAMMRQRRVSSSLVWSRIREFVSTEEMGAAIARVFVEAMASTHDPDLRPRVRDLMDQLRGAAPEDELERVRNDAVFADPMLHEALDRWAEEANSQDGPAATE